MTDQQSPQSGSGDLSSFVQKHKTALIIGAVVIGLFALADDGQQGGPYQGQPQQGGGDPYVGNDPYQDPYYEGGGGGGGSDPYEEWKKRQEMQDEGQRRFTEEVIREVQTCTKDDGTIVYDVPTTVDCESLN